MQSIVGRSTAVLASVAAFTGIGVAGHEVARHAAANGRVDEALEPTAQEMASQAIFYYGYKEDTNSASVYQTKGQQDKNKWTIRIDKTDADHNPHGKNRHVLTAVVEKTKEIGLDPGTVSYLSLVSYVGRRQTLAITMALHSNLLYGSNWSASEQLDDEPDAPSTTSDRRDITGSGEISGVSIAKDIATDTHFSFRRMQ